MSNIMKCLFQNAFSQGEWLDGRPWKPYDFPLAYNLLPISHCLDDTWCINETTHHIEEGKCSALKVQHGFHDYTISKVNCKDISTAVLFCENNVQASVPYENDLSDIKIYLTDKNYHILYHSQSCPMGWFVLGNYCINVFVCNNCVNETVADKVCRRMDGKLASDIFIPYASMDHNQQLLVNETNEWLTFWNLFSAKRSYIIKAVNEDQFPIYFSVNMSNLCKIAMDMTDCKKHTHLTVRQYNIFKHHLVTEMSQKLYMQNNREQLAYSSFRDVTRSIEYMHNGLPLHIWFHNFEKPVFMRPLAGPRIDVPSYVLCEKAIVKKEVSSSSCSRLYLTCDDGTCVHDALVCDGQKHCPNGEDEQNCQHICNDPNVNCITECSIDKRCICSDNYFQCFSGGCIPLQKLCDNTEHCTDGSDEPNTCVYIRAEQLQFGCVSLNEISSYVNELMLEMNKQKRKCFSDEQETAVNSTYKMHPTPSRCKAEQLPSTILFPCADVDVQVASDNFININNMCIKDTTCNPMAYCSNGFHLIDCQDVFCSGKFKCPRSYCIPLSDVCNIKCDCPHCEEESFCERLLCPGIVLIPYKDASLSCTSQVEHVKYSLNKRQVIHGPALQLSDDFPVYVRLDSIDSKNSLQYIREKPEIIVYLRMNNIDILWRNINEGFERMVSMETLDLSHNDINSIDVRIFMSMIKLKLLDLSYNLIRSIQKAFLCPFKNLKYLFINNNLIASIHKDIFIENYQLKQIMMENNKLYSRNVEITPSDIILDLMSSDLPRFCCLFRFVENCSPTFPAFMSCKNMIASKLQMAIAWCVGITTCFLNMLCFCALVKVILRILKSSRKAVEAMLISLNLCLAELLSSFCLFSYSIFNVIYAGHFGLVIDQWRYSVQCLLLESFFAVSSQCSLAFGVYMTLHFAIYIPSMIKHDARLKRTLLITMMIWFVVTLACILGQIAQRAGQMDEYNYFCLPFVTSNINNPLLLAFHASFVSLDFLCVCVCIALNTYLFIYVVKQSSKKVTSTVKQARLIRFAIRMTVLILTSTVSWIPVIILQIINLSGHLITQDVFLWVLLVSFTFNLILDPILVLQNAFKN